MRKRGFELGLISKHRQFIFGFCALWIVFYHMPFAIPYKHILIPIGFIKRTGEIGVDVFLILSAMGMYYSLNNNSSVPRFYKRRLLRVYLPTLVFMTAYLITAQIITGDVRLGEYLGFVIPPLGWLGYEMLWFTSFIIPMYFIYPLIYKTQNKLPWLPLTLVPVFMALPSILENIAPEWTEAHEIGITRIPVFLVGCALAPYIKQNRRIPYIALIIPLVSFIIMRYGKVWPEWRYAYIYLALFLIVLLPTAAEWINRVRILRPIDTLMRFYGMMSLEIYITHMFAENTLKRINILQNVTGRQYLIALISFSISTLAAFLLNRLCGFIAGKIDSIGANQSAINHKP